MEGTKRKLASIQRIVDLQPVENSDFLEVATVLGWHCVVAKKDNFKVNDLVCYFEVDSLLPLKPEFEFLAKGSKPKKQLVEGKEIEGYRIKTIKLRGQISQGLVFPLSLFEVAERIALKEGDDVTLALGVHKYELPVPAQLAGKVRGNFPGFLPKTDETRLQAEPGLLKTYKDVLFYATEKIDGSSCTFVIKNDEFHVCSRNLDLLDDGVNTLWKVAKEMRIEEKLRKGNEIAGGERWALQGEIYGEGIQANPLKITGQRIAFFNIYDFVDGKFSSFSAFDKGLRAIELPGVPIVAHKVTLFETVDEMVAYSTRKSSLNPNVWAEGLVWRPMEEVQDPDLGRLSFKVINPEYLLKHES